MKLALSLLESKIHVYGETVMKLASSLCTYQYFPPDWGGGGGGGDTMEIRHQNNPSPRELDKTHRQGVGKLDTFSRSS